MSSTIILALWPEENRQEEVETLPNSWGSAPYVWDALYNRYIPKEHSYSSWLTDSDLGARVDKLVNDQSLPIHQRVVLGMTFVKAYISNKDMDKAADMIDRFFQDFPIGAGKVNHWPKISEMLRTTLKKYPAVGFWWTTVSDNEFIRYDENLEDQDDPYVTDFEGSFDLFEAFREDGEDL